MEALRSVCVRLSATVHHHHYRHQQRIGHALLVGDGWRAASRTFIRSLQRSSPPSTTTTPYVRLCLRRSLYEVSASRSSTAANLYRCYDVAQQRRYLALSDSVLRASGSPEAQRSSARSPVEDGPRRREGPALKDASAPAGKGSIDEAGDRAELPDDDDLKDKSLFVRFKEYFKKYWYLMLPVHMVTSSLYFGAFYYLATLGLSPIPLLEHWGVPQTYLESITASGFGDLAVALAFYKVATPLRYLTTLGVCGVTVKHLRKRGLLRSSAEIQTIFRSKVKDMKEKR